jgi:NDP-sugar pyrophosphorylase family protein
MKMKSQSKKAAEMDIIITAGGIPKPSQPLYKYTQGKPKALLDIGGKPMIQWVLDAVSEAKGVGQVAVVGLAQSEVEGLDGSVDLSCSKPLTLLPNQGSMIGNIRAGLQSILEKNPDAEYVMTVSSDIPLVTGEMFDWFIEQAKDTQHEFYMNMITRQVLEASFPGVKRRVNRVGKIEYRGAPDISILQPRIVMQKDGAAERIEKARGKIWRQLNFIGFDTLFLLMLRLLELDAFVKRLGNKHGVDLHPIICPYPEIAMDVDHPQHLEMMRKELSTRK